MNLQEAIKTNKKLLMTQVNILESELARLMAELPKLQRAHTLNKWTPGEWEAQRKLKQLASEIDMLERRIYNLKRHTK
jgi:hypothetical protein